MLLLIKIWMNIKLKPWNKIHDGHNNIMQLQDGIFSKNESTFKKRGWFIASCWKVHNLNVPHEHEILKLKDNYVHMFHGPIIYNQGVVWWTPLWLLKKLKKFTLLCIGKKLLARDLWCLLQLIHCGGENTLKYILAYNWLYLDHKINIRDPERV